MKIDEFRKRLEEECQSLNFPKPEVIKQGFSFINVELRIQPEVTIEIYFNEETQSLTSALVIQDKRIFGINGYPKRGAWHMHPLGRAEEHIKINPMEIEQILEEYAKALHQLSREEWFRASKKK